MAIALNGLSFAKNSEGIRTSDKLPFCSGLLKSRRITGLALKSDRNFEATTERDGFAENFCKHGCKFFFDDGRNICCRNCFFVRRQQFLLWSDFRSEYKWIFLLGLILTRWRRRKLHLDKKMLLSEFSCLFSSMVAFSYFFKFLQNLNCPCFFPPVREDA